MGKKRKTPGINGSSSADIAFMLLIFFLITTSMDTDKGLARRLPPPVPKDQKNDTDVDIKKRNVAPRVGAWIETGRNGYHSGGNGRTPCGCVD